MGSLCQRWNCAVRRQALPWTRGPLRAAKARDAKVNPDCVRVDLADGLPAIRRDGCRAQIAVGGGLVSPEEMEAYLKANPGPLKGK
jgi:hypothetical protein